MELLWNADELSIKDVQQRLEQDKPVNFNTVMTVMNRLVEKGILKKEITGKTFTISAGSIKGSLYRRAI
ncbi:hypothetical protein GCM10020331_021640 [Ectobacillus funiculus]